MVLHHETFPSLHYKERHVEENANTQCLCSQRALLILLSVNHFTLPCVVFVGRHIHLFSQFPPVFKSNMFIFLYPSWTLPTSYVFFVFLFAFISWNGNFVDAIFFFFLTWKGETKKTLQPMLVINHLTFQRRCVLKAHDWFSLTLPSHTG